MEIKPSSVTHRFTFRYINHFATGVDISAFNTRRWEFSPRILARGRHDTSYLPELRIRLLRCRFSGAAFSTTR
ncbi:hypothetical protein TNCV_932901 [Trichonephila clavipes]|nr:hypothetical protein TNCV_932901 [Trichonephila clavipes]